MIHVSKMIQSQFGGIWGCFVHDHVDRAVLRAYKTILGTADEVTPQKRLELRAKLEMLSDTSEDDRVRLGALKQLFEIDRQIADYEMQLFTHDNPAVQKQEVTVKSLPVPPSRLEVVITHASN